MHSISKAITVMKAALVLGAEFHDWDESMGHCAGEEVQFLSSPMKSCLPLTCTAHGFSEKQEKNHGLCWKCQQAPYQSREMASTRLWWEGCRKGVKVPSKNGTV